MALYDFVGQTEEELSFQQGDRILVTQHVDAEWCSGRLNGREGFFPTAFVETSSGNNRVFLWRHLVVGGEFICLKYKARSFLFLYLKYLYFWFN